MRQINTEKSNLISYLQESPPAIHIHTHTHGSESSHTKEVHRQKGKMSIYIYIVTLSCGIGQGSWGCQGQEDFTGQYKKKSGFRYLGDYPAIQMRTLR